MTLGLRALLNRIEEAAKATGVDAKDFRVAHKRNKAGDLVVALILKADAPGFTSISDEV